MNKEYAEEVAGRIIEQLPARGVEAGPTPDAAAALEEAHRNAVPTYSPLETWQNLEATARELGLVAAVRLNPDPDYREYRANFQVSYTHQDGTPSGITTGIFMDGKALTGVNGERVSPFITEDHESQSIDLRTALTRERAQRRAAEVAAQHDAMAKVAQAVWNEAAPATADHPYCAAKGITHPGENGLRVVPAAVSDEAKAAAVRIAKLAGIAEIIERGDRAAYVALLHAIIEQPGGPIADRVRTLYERVQHRAGDPEFAAWPQYQAAYWLAEAMGHFRQ